MSNQQIGGPFDSVLEAGGGGTPTDITVANEATDTSCFPLFATAATGDLGPKSNAGLTFNSNTGELGATILTDGSASLTGGELSSATIGSGNTLGGVTMTLGSDADGDIYYRASNTLTRLPKGTALQQLRMNAGATAPEWADASGFDWGASISGSSGNGLTISPSAGAEAGIRSSGQSSSSSTTYRSINLTNPNNSGAGYHTGIKLVQNSTTWNGTVTGSATNLDGAAIAAYSNASGVQPLVALGGRDNANFANSMLWMALTNTQSGATVMQKIDLGTSAQGHTGLLINAYNASTSARGAKYDLSSTGTGTAIEVTGTNASARVFEIADGLTQAGGTATGTTTKEIKITIGGTDYIIETKSQA